MKIITDSLNILCLSTNIIIVIKHVMGEACSMQRSDEKYIHFSMNCKGVE
jgi:hypothetical protein